jgi:hypothetical protein
MLNRFPEAGLRRGLLLTWADDITREAFALDPVFMGEKAVKIFGHPAWSWIATDISDSQVHAICRCAMLVRLQSHLSLGGHA